MLSFFPRDVLDGIWDLVGSVSEGFPTYFNLSFYLVRRWIRLYVSTFKRPCNGLTKKAWVQYTILLFIQKDIFRGQKEFRVLFDARDCL